MIADSTLHAVAAHLDIEADMLVEKTRHVAELFGPESAHACIERSIVLKGYAQELRNEAIARALSSS
jgi:hypothetical protein